MIVKSVEEVIGCKSDVVDELWPVSNERAEGELVVGERVYDAVITCEKGIMTKARVSIADGISDDDAIEKAALECARRGLADPLWAPLVVDPNDGETVYAVTMTVNPTSEALDRFFAQARDFLLAHGDEVDAIVGRSDSDDDGNDNTSKRDDEGDGNDSTRDDEGDHDVSEGEAAVERFLDHLLG